MNNVKTMNYGVALPYTSARTIATLCQLAEAAGRDGCFTGDAIWCEDPMIGLAAAAMITDRIRLGTMITPVLLRSRGNWRVNRWPWTICATAVSFSVWPLARPGWAGTSSPTK